MVLKIFAALTGLVKVRVTYTDIDSHVFRLHYRLTSSICFIACALVSATEYIGEPIQCMNNNKAVDGPINTYCWISSTFTINTTDDEGNIGGLGTYHQGKHEKTYHAYYQWVPFILFFQGCLFYLPHLLWKATERKTAHMLLQGLDHFSIDPDIEKKKENIIKYLKASRGSLKYSLGYHVFEFLNFVNVLGNMLFLDVFFNGTFMNYGTKVLNYAIDGDDDDNPFKTVFPKITKCTFKRIGPSGTVESSHPLCLLPQNIMNEKIFIILWFWFIMLATFTGMQLIWRMVVCLTPVIRVHLIEKRAALQNCPANFERSIRLLHLGDFFLLEILGRNLDASTFRQILKGAVFEEHRDPNSNALYPPLPAPEDGIDAIGMDEIRS